MRIRLTIGMLGLVLLFGTGHARAEDRPSNRNLVLAGMAMGIPTYALGLVVHEGSHALAAKTIGANIKHFSLIPGKHPTTGTFYFGYVTVTGLRTNKQRAWFLLAPKLSDSLVLGGFAILQGTDSLPSNHYAQTAVLVLATGFWVDFSKDIVSFSKFNDTIKVYRMLGLDTELKKLPARLLHLGLSVTMGYAIYRGYEDLFETKDTGAQPFLFPMIDGNF